MRLAARYSLKWLIQAILLGLSAAFALIPFLSDLSSRADLITQFLLQGAALTVAFALLAVFLRHWKFAGAHTLCLLVQIFHMQPPLIPNTAAASTQTVRLVFSNLWADNHQRAAAMHTLERLDADILVTAETVNGWREDLAAISDDFGAEADCFNLSGCDLVIHSRFPIVNTQTPAERWNRSRAVYAGIETPAGILGIIGAHMTRPIPVGQVHHQQKHAELLTSLASEIEGPLVLVGDFNAVTWGRVVRQIERDSGLSAHRGMEGTWPSAMPWPFRLPIDHIFTSDDVEIVSREVVNLPGSDHHAVMVELRLRSG